MSSRSMKPVDGSRLGTRLAALGTAVALVLSAAACGSSSDSGATPATDSAGTAQEGEATFKTGFVNGGGKAGGDARDGGTLKLGMYSQIRSLDPADSQGSGATGAVELAAIYDVLMRYDYESQSYKPQLAQALTPSEDATTWTLKLRPGVTFSDGTPLDSAAVKFTLDRLVQEKASSASLITTNVASIETPDPATVVFTLKHPWAGFPYVLATTPGMIVSPTAAKAAGDGFASKPVGAGPFTLERFAPGEELVLTAREDYWGGRPHLDQVRFVALGGAAITLESFQSGGVQVAFLREPQVIREAVGTGAPGFLSVANAGNVLLINNGARGQKRPGSDVRVRRAIAMAIDPKIINERAYDGAGMPTSELFGPSSRWSSDVPGIPYDPERAKTLLAEVKKEAGYDGVLHLVGNTTPSSKNAALAIEAMLEAVGFEVDNNSTFSVSAMVRKIFVDADYDIALYGYSIYDSAPYAPLSQQLLSTSKQNPNGYNSPEMDGLIGDLAATRDEAKRQAILDRIQQTWNETVPAAIYVASPTLFTWNKTVHGIVPSQRAMLLLGDAWIEG